MSARPAQITNNWSRRPDVPAYPLPSNDSSRGIRLNSEPIVDGTTQPLLASEIALRRLDREVSEEKLDLVEFPAGQMAQSRARAPKIVRRQLVDVGAGSGSADDIPQYLRRHPIAPDAPYSVDGAEHDAVRDSRGDRPFVDRGFHPGRNRHRAHMPTLANQVGNHPAVFALLN